MPHFRAGVSLGLAKTARNWVKSAAAVEQDRLAPLVDSLATRRAPLLPPFPAEPDTQGCRRPLGLPGSGEVAVCTAGRRRPAQMSPSPRWVNTRRRTSNDSLRGTYARQRCAVPCYCSEA